MKILKTGVLFALCAMMVIMSGGGAEAANGTLTATFQYKDPATGNVTNLTSAFFYFHDATKPPPMEKYFSKADYILWGSFGNGNYQISVPAGTWYLRINQRVNVPSTSQYMYGPPQQNDYTWMQTIPITIVAGQTLNLGTVYAYHFGSAPITISGAITNASGAPLAGRYVRAQTVPCIADGYNYNINQCGPVKDLALNPTDASGKYTLQLKSPGTYYIYTSPCISAQFNQYTGNVCSYTPAAVNPITVNTGDSKTVNIIAY
ncbi:MAG TPA: carboxypeptidase-like regulatory domain-containing protein [Desulfuromonadaceae bacterium]